ncbi:MAG: VOC family protein [Polyangiales bacterium]
MKPTPPGWPRISSCVYYDDPAAAIDWLGRAFGFEVRLKVEGEGGRIEHCELSFGEGLVMVGGTGRGDAGKDAWQRLQTSPRAKGGANTQSLCVMVDDADAHCARAKAAGAAVIREPETSDYGADYWADRSYGALDPEGHLWWFIQRVRTGGVDAS